MPTETTLTYPGLAWFYETVWRLTYTLLRAAFDLTIVTHGLPKLTGSAYGSMADPMRALRCADPGCGARSIGDLGKSSETVPIAFHAREADGVLTGVLRVIHKPIGFAHQLAPSVAVARWDQQSAHAARHRITGCLKNCGKAAVQIMGELARRVDRSNREQRGELIAAYAAEAVMWAQLADRAGREVLQHVVAGLVAVPVVHGLEAVEV